MPSAGVSVAAPGGTGRAPAGSVPLAAVVLVAAGLVFGLRSSSFFRTVQNWDESLYVLVAQSLLDGHPLYAEVWELKPPGLYLPFAAAELVFGRTIVGIRVLGCLAVLASSVLLFRIGRSLRHDGVGLLAAFLYVVFSSIPTGLATNSELLFAPFILAAFHLFFAHGAEGLVARPRRALALGFFAAYAVQVKPVAAFEVLALLGLILASALRGERPLDAGRLARLALLLAAGPLAIALAILLYFGAYGMLDAYVEANFTVNLRFARASRLELATVLHMIQLRMRESFPLWLCLALAPGAALFMRSLGPTTRWQLAALALWAAFAMVAICSTGRMYGHYFLQILPPLCLVTALFLSAALEEGGALPPSHRVLVLVLVLAGSVLRTVATPLADTAAFVKHRVLRGEAHWGDPVSEVVEVLRARMRPDDVLYVVDDQPILYWLVPARTPTRFVFPAHLARADWRALVGVDLEREVTAIFDRRPLYVVATVPEKRLDDFRGSELYPLVERLLEERGYRFEQTVGGVNLYRRGDGAA